MVSEIRIWPVLKLGKNVQLGMWRVVEIFYDDIVSKTIKHFAVTDLSYGQFLLSIKLSSLSKLWTTGRE